MSLTRKVHEAWSAIDGERSFDSIDRYFAPEFVRHGRRELRLDGFRQILRELHEGFPDLVSEVVDAVEQGDRVAYRWSSTGTHLGPYLGVPPTRRAITASGITISRFADGRIVEDWASWNELTVLHDLGILPIDRG